MEPLSIGYYAIICGLLSMFAPTFGGIFPRFAAGAAVGFMAAATLPMVIGLMEY